MVDAVSSSGVYPNTQPTSIPAKPASTSAPAAAPPQGAPTDTNAAGGTGDVSQHVDGDLTKVQALSQSQSASQQLAGSNLSIANRSPQALSNALPNQP